MKGATFWLFDPFKFKNNVTLPNLKNENNFDLLTGYESMDNYQNLTFSEHETN